MVVHPPETSIITGFDRHSDVAGESYLKRLSQWKCGGGRGRGGWSAGCGEHAYFLWPPNRWPLLVSV